MTKKELKIRRKEVLQFLYDNTTIKLNQISNQKSHEYYDTYSNQYLLDSFLNERKEYKKGEDSRADFMLMIDKIVSDDFNVSDYYIYRNPFSEVFCFRNMSNTEGFDLHYFYGSNIYVYSSYIDENNNMQDTNTIQEAVNKYCRENLL